MTRQSAAVAYLQLLLTKREYIDENTENYWGLPAIES